jgi:hypothetical protein
MNDGNDLPLAFRASGSQHPILSEKERLLRLYEAQDARRPPPSASTQSPPTLAMFIAYALHRTRLHPSVTFAALYLLQRLKTRFVAARGSSSHRLFISAFMIASKVICDDTYSNKSWCIVGQGMFALREINQMEREMCSYLEWQLNVDPSALKEFEAMVRRDFKGPGPYPSSYSLPAPASGPFAHPKLSTNLIGTAIPSFGPISQHPPSSSPPKSSVLSKTSPHPARPTLSRQSSGDTYPSPPGSPPTPASSPSTSVSPAASISPVTPPNYEGDNAKIVSSMGSNTMQISGDNVSPPHYHMHSVSRKSPPPTIHSKSHSTDAKHSSPTKTTMSAPYQHPPVIKATQQLGRMICDLLRLQTVATKRTSFGRSSVFSTTTSP